MSSKLKLATQLLKINDFSLAKLILEKEINDEKSLYWLSLLYRLDDEYDKENTVVNRGLQLKQNWSYMQERKAWHDRPLFHHDLNKSKLVARECLNLPRNPQLTPSQEALDQVCFVTAGGSDEPFRTFLFELLESIQNTSLYKDIPVFILDTGLTEDDKQILFDRFKNIQGIKDPGWDIDENLVKKYLSKPNLNGYKASTSRPFMAKHFPGYRYYFWLDTDLWIQDERSIDEVLQLTLKQGGAFAKDSFQHSFAGLYRDVILPKYKTEELLNKQALLSGFLCVDDTRGFLDQWCRLYIEHAENGLLHHWTEQMTFNMTANILVPNFQILTPQKTHFIFINQPLSYDGKILYNSNQEVIGIFGLEGAHMKSERRFHTQVLKYGSNNQALHTSVSFRTWPWADKPLIRKMLMDEANAFEN